MEGREAAQKEKRANAEWKQVMSHGKQGSQESCSLARWGSAPPLCPD